jgi:hypothetical protein
VVGALVDACVTPLMLQLAHCSPGMEPDGMLPAHRSSV